MWVTEAEFSHSLARDVGVADAPGVVHWADGAALHALVAAIARAVPRQAGGERSQSVVGQERTHCIG